MTDVGGLKPGGWCFQLGISENDMQFNKKALAHSV